MNILRISSFLFMPMIFIAACSQHNETTSADKNVIETDTTFVSAVRMNFPDAPGSEDFRRNCLSCHSASYVQMQPQFPRTTWENIVNKMIKTFGAPIPDSAAKNIVNYIISIFPENEQKSTKSK